MSKAKDIAVASVARSDFGRLLPCLKLIEKEPRYNLHLLASGNHCDKEYGNSIEEIEEHGFSPVILDAGSGTGCNKAAKILKIFGKWFEAESPDYLIILGDRYEMLAIAQAAVMHNVPIIHIGGGYTTIGAIDDKIRHAITALSVQHIVASEKCRDKVLASGQRKKVVHMFGAPDLEILNEVEEVGRGAFCNELGLDPEREFCLVTFHPETGVNFEANGSLMKAAADFLGTIEEQILITSPCADPGAYAVFNLINDVKKKKTDTVFVESLGIQRYVNAMRHASCMIGNSSSGIIEAASMKLPVINVGDRQGGREQSGNVINSKFDEKHLESAYEVAITQDFRTHCQSVKNVYGDGQFSGKFIQLLKKICW